MPLFVASQTVTISPIPQSVEWGEQAFQNTASYNLIGAEQADADAVATLRKHFNTAGGDIDLIIGQRGDEAISEYESLIPSKTEGYYLSVAPGKVVIAGNDAAGTFYGVQSYLQIASQPKVMSVTVSDYPSVADRGVVEGFYGNPWSHTDRLRQFEFYGANKMNVYIYGPKDDPYHRGQWRINYPAAQANKLRELVDAAHKNKVQFVWAVHPGNDIKWNKTDSLNIVRKLESVYSLGVRAFAVFFDDISGEGAKAIKQAQLLNYINQEFTHRHDDVAPLILCPTQYNRGWAGGDYLSVLGSQMDKDVRIMWTGNSVVDMINKSDMTWINGQIGRKAYIWLNYPVNDYCTDRMLMGPTYGNDKNIATQLSGFTSNPMEYAEASKVSLYSIADYTWNMEAYNETESWERAIKYLMPDHAGAFRLFCEHNIDLGTSTHGLRRANESAAFKAKAATFETAVANGYTSEIGAPIAQEFDAMVNAAEVLLNSTTGREMIDEIECWLKVFKVMGEKGQKIMAMYEAYTNEQPEVFVQNYEEFLALDAHQKTIISRNFNGSIKKPNPTVGGEVLVPFMKRNLQQLIINYKKKFDYRRDIFPTTLLEDGRYYIKVNGKYLTNKNANPDRVGDYPVFQNEADVINPQRQEWTISLDPSTERYKIVNTQDGRYINEYGSFWADKRLNPFEAVWHTYNIYRLNGKYAIQNAGSSGNNFWNSNGTRINKSNSSDIVTGNFIFDLIPIDTPADHPTIDPDETYYIIYNGKALENTNPSGSGGNPTFRKLNPESKRQQWKLSVVDAVGRYKITSALDNRYVNELGEFGTNQFYNSWNTYILTELGGKYSIQNASDAGTDFWNTNGTRIQKGNLSRKDSYIYEILPTSVVNSVQPATSETHNISYTYDGNTIFAQSDMPVTTLSLFDFDGRIMKSVNDSQISLNGIAKSNYILLICTTCGQKEFKLRIQ